MIYLLELIAWNTGVKTLDFRDYVLLMSGQGGFLDIHEKADSVVGADHG